MKKTFFAGLLSISFLFNSCSELQNIASTVGLSDIEKAAGLREALTQGLFAGFDAFANPNNGNALVRFAFPGDAAKIEKTLRDLGLTSVVNSLTTKYTNAMGQAVKEAKPIFLNSVKNMSFRDITGILVTRNNHAATDYFKTSMLSDLMTTFRPIVENTIQLNGGDKEYQTVVRAYNALPLGNKKLETNLTDFISGRVIDGMFLYVGNEEEKIRTQLSARTTPLLQKVFGFADQQLRGNTTRGGGLIR